MATTEKTVREIIDMVREHVRKKFADDAGFKAAYVIGSMNRMDPDALFPTFRDIDVGVITDSVEDLHNEEELVGGYIVETVQSNPRFYADASALLSDARYTDNVAYGTILLDPARFLGPLSAQVRAQFKRRKWVRARCKRELEVAAGCLEQMERASDVGAFLTNYGTLVMRMTCALSLGHLLSPTHRRGPVNLRDALARAGDQAVYDGYLEMAGVREVSEDRARGLLDEAAALFDLAVMVFRTPIPYAYKLEPFIRPYLVDGTQDIFKDGGFREAIFWIARFYVVAAMVVINDGTPEQQAAAGQKLSAFLDMLGIGTDEARKARAALCRAFLETARKYVADLTTSSPLLDD